MSPATFPLTGPSDLVLCGDSSRFIRNKESYTHTYDTTEHQICHMWAEGRAESVVGTVVSVKKGLITVRVPVCIEPGTFCLNLFEQPSFPNVRESTPHPSMRGVVTRCRSFGDNYLVQLVLYVSRFQLTARNLATTESK